MTHEIIGSNRKLEELLHSGGPSAEELLKRIEEFKVPVESPIESPIVKINPEQSYEGLLPSDATETPYGSLTKTVEFYGHELVESDANVMNEFFDRALSKSCIEAYLDEEWIKIENNRFVEVKFLQTNLSEFLKELGYLTGLQEACFVDNSLSSLPESFGNWRDLRGASFNHNSLSSLPESFGNWGKLEYAYFHNNSLSSLPESFGNWRDLKRAYFHNNSLSSLPESFGNWGKLREAYFEDNFLNDDSKKILDKLEESTGAVIYY